MIEFRPAGDDPVPRREGAEPFAADGGLGDGSKDASPRTADHLRLLCTAADIILAAREPDALLAGLFAELSAKLGVDTCLHFTTREPGDGLRLDSCFGVSDSEARSIECLELSDAVDGAFALARGPVVASHIQDRADLDVSVLRGCGFRAYACNPLTVDGRLIGSLSFASRSRDDFTPGEIEIFRVLSRNVAIALERMQTTERLVVADRRKDEFLATLAHEIRNPLGAVCNAVEILERAGADESIAGRVREVMRRQLQQMVLLLDDLLDISRITSGKLELQKTRVDIAAVIGNAVESSRARIEANGQSLEIVLPVDSIRLFADAHRLEQVFANLLVNAAKFTPKGGRIVLATEPRGHEIVVSVRDDGAGIPREQLDAIFELYSQAEPLHDVMRGGLGIGLTLAKRLVELHGGTIEAKSDGPGAGSEFVVHLPIARHAGSESSERPPQGRSPWEYRET